MAQMVLAVLQTLTPEKPDPTTGEQMNLEGYVPVNDRLLEALRRWPDLRVSETGFEIQRIEEQVLLICEITVWRTADDPKPTIATAAEPFPGKTPYTRNSERMVGFTSALGRALGYMGIGIDKALASSNEVEARQNRSEGSQRASAKPGPPEEPTEAQRRMLRALGYVGEIPATKKGTSILIDKLKAEAMGEEPF
jgi:hypothetical protein